MNGQRPLVHVCVPPVAEVKSYNQQTPAFLEHVFTRYLGSMFSVVEPTHTS